MIGIVNCALVGVSAVFVTTGCMVVTVIAAIAALLVDLSVIRGGGRDGGDQTPHQTQLPTRCPARLMTGCGSLTDYPQREG